MFAKKTLFIVGAGASREVGLPTGAELANIIARSATLKEDDVFLAIMRARPANKDVTDARLSALKRIAQGIHLARSIDSFIDQNPGEPAIAEMGKLLIAKTILDAERKSPLWVKESEGRLDIRKKVVADSWLDQLAAMLFQGLRKDDLHALGQNIAVVCFNYDRCIEHYLMQALLTTYGLPYRQAQDLVRSVRIIHPYGQIGALPGQEYETDERHAVPFGHAYSPSEVWNLKDGLRTFSESAGSDVRGKIDELVREADQFVFLGFSFAEQNIALLTARNVENRDQVAYASGFGIPEQARSEICRRMLSICGLDPVWPAVSGHPYNSVLEIGATASEVLSTHSYNLLRR